MTSPFVNETPMKGRSTCRSARGQKTARLTGDSWQLKTRSSDALAPKGIGDQVRLMANRRHQPVA